MRIRVMRLGSAAALVAAGVLSGAAAGASTKPPHVHASTMHQYGVIGGGSPALPSLFRGAAMVRAGNGDEFVVGQRHVKGKHRVFQMVFLVHRHGDAHWHERPRNAATPPICKGTKYAAQLSPDGKHVIVEVDSCGANLYVVDAGTKRFGAAPQVRQVASHDAFVDAAALPHDHVALLLSTGDEPAVTSGSAKHGFAALTVLPAPTGDSLPQTTVAPEAITRDATTGELIVIGNDYATTGVYAYTKAASGSWSGATPLAPPPTPTGDPILALDVAAARGHVAVWACRYPEYGSDPDDGNDERNPTCGTFDRKPSGAWSGFKAYPGNQASFDSRWGGTLAMNPKTGALHVVWLPMHDSTAGSFGIASGLKHVARVHGRWTTPKYLLRGQVQGPLSVALTAAGHPVVGYQLPHY